MLRSSDLKIAIKMLISVSFLIIKENIQAKITKLEI